MEYLPFVACIIMACHYHDHVPVWLWIVTVACVVFGETGVRIRKHG